MRQRLLTAVQALLADPAVAGLRHPSGQTHHPAQVAALVLMAKARADDDGWTTGRSRIWSAELGRWLGMHESHVDHSVLPALRKAGVVRTTERRNDLGHPIGLSCELVSVKRARGAENRPHPLLLTRVELATLLRLVEAVFGPGWAPKNAAATPPGLLADRMGRGAATDRLALLLMVLRTTHTGWLPLCPGTVDTGRGRPAATVARMLGCKAASAAKVLSRLAPMVQVERRPTESGLRQQSRVRVIPVASAWGRTIPAAVESGPVSEVFQEENAAFSELSSTAPGDLGPAGLDVDGASPAETAGELGDSGDLADRAVDAPLHAAHAPVADLVGEVEVESGFSGARAVGAEDHRPQRACAREEAPDNPQAPRQDEVGGSSRPLRGEKRDITSLHQGNRQGGVPAWAGRALPVRLPRQDVFGALGSAMGLWTRITRPTAHRLVERMVRQELAAVAGFAGAERADQVLSDRLMNRLLEQGGPDRVRDPIAWLTKRGLPKRGCGGDVRCDDGLLMDTGMACAHCAMRVGDRRAVRLRIVREVRAALPRATDEELRAAVEARLADEVTAAGWDRAARHAHAEELRREREARLAEQQVTAAAAAAAHRALPCAVCGAPESDGLCGVCREHANTADLLEQAVDVQVALAVEADDFEALLDAHTAPVAGWKWDLLAWLRLDREQAQAGARAEIDQAVMQIREEGGVELTAAVVGRLAAVQALSAARRRAERVLTSRVDVRREVRAVFDLELRSRPLGETEAERHAAAQRAADRARQATAEQLLADRLRAVHPAGAYYRPVLDPHAAACASEIRQAMQLRRDERREYANAR